MGGCLPERDIAPAGPRLVVFVLFSLTAGSFLTVISFQSMGFQVAEVALISLAMMLAMLTGGIDLSVVSISSVSAIVTRQAVRGHRRRQRAGTDTARDDDRLQSAGIAAGTACGLINGFLIARLRITPILATLGTCRSLNGLIGSAWTGRPGALRHAGQLPGIGGRRPRAGPPLRSSALLRRGLVHGDVRQPDRDGTALKLVGANETAAHYSGLDRGGSCT